MKAGMRVSGPTDDTYFTEEQHFPLWIKAFPLLTAAAAAVLLVVLAIGGLSPAAVVAGALLVLVFLPLAVLHFAMKLVTRLDASGLHLRIHPARWSLLPRRMTQKDVPFGDMSRWTVRTYHSLASREFWGWHFWGLSAAKGGRYLYIMQPSGPTSGRGVQVELKSGEVLLIGSKDPQKFADLIGSVMGTRS
jgi:hypothetical protein